MPPVLVNNGRVTSRDATLFAEGELAEAQDCYYKPGNPALHSIGGRQQFTSSSFTAGSLVGGTYIEFDDGTSWVVLHAGTSYQITAASGLSTFASIGGFDASDYSLSGSPKTLDRTHYNNQHILCDGVNRNRVVFDNGGTKQQLLLGMNLSPAPTIGRDDGAGAGFILTSGKTLTYWVEERVKINGLIVKRSAPSAQAILTGDGTTDKPRLYHGSFANPDTTHWALFSTATDGAYPTGAEIAEAPAATAFIDDSRSGTDPGLPAGTAFDTISASIAGVTFTTAKHGPAPIASTADVFEDAIVCNDVSDPSIVAFSVTDAIHSWPDKNRIRFETKAYDKVVAVRALDNFVIVLLRSGAWRISTLPQTTDQAFSPERAKSEILGAYGSVNARAVVKFTFGEGERLAYVSRYGIVVTDGARWATISDDMDWENEVDITKLDQARLTNNSRLFRLEFTYVPVGGTRATRTAFLHYHASHAKVGQGSALRAKMTWPINRDATDTWQTTISDTDEILSANADGKVYRHDQGFTEPVMSGGITMKVRTGEIFPLDIGGHVTVRDFWTHHQAASGQTAKVRLIQRNEGEAEASGEANIALDFREATPCGRQGLAESVMFEFEISNPTAAVALDYFAPDIDPAGKTEEV